MQGEIDGYNFKNEEKINASYLYVLKCFDFLDGPEASACLSREKWINDGYFYLPFRLSAELDSDGSSNVDHLPITKNNSYQFYLRYNQPSTYVVRMSCMYYQSRSLMIDAMRSTWRDFEVDQ